MSWMRDRERDWIQWRCWGLHVAARLMLHAAPRLEMVSCGVEDARERGFLGVSKRR